MHGSRQPRRKRLAEALEPGRGEGQQTRAMVRAVERDDSRLAGREQCGAQGDLDGVLAGDAELRGPGERVAEPLSHFCLCQVAERMNDRGVVDRLDDARIAMPERRDAEAPGQVDELAPVRVPDAAALGPGPDQAPLRRPIRRPSVSAAM